MVVAADQHGSAACVAGGIDVPAEQADVVARSRNAAAGLLRAGARNIQRTAHVQSTALHVTHQPDRAVAVLNRLRLDNTGIVHRALQQAASRLRGQQYLSTIGLDQATVLYQRVHCALVYRHVKQTVTRHVERDGVAGSQCHAAESGPNHAVVGDVGTQQRDIAAVGVDVALIDDCAAADTGKFVVAGHEVTVGEVQAGGHQTANIDRGAVAEQDAVRIEQEHFAVGAQAAQNARRIRAQHPVECD